MWLAENGKEGQSVCEVLMSRGGWWTDKRNYPELNKYGWSHVGPAEVFLSHVQLEDPNDTFRAVKDIGNRSTTARRGTKHRDSRIWLE